MAKTDTPTDVVADESIIEKILDLFQSNSVAIEYGEDPQGWVEENLPEGTEAGDIARCMPEVAERLGGPYQANAVRYNAHYGSHGHAATTSVVNELSYTYNTVYQQNTYIHAEEGSQVVNIQGDGNHVDQTQIDADFGTEYPEDEVDEGYEDGELPEESPVDELDEVEDPMDPMDPADDPTTDEADEVDQGADPWNGVDEAVEPADQADGWDDGSSDGTEGWDDGLDETLDPGPAADPGMDPGMDASPEAANPFDGAEEAMA